MTYYHIYAIHHDGTCNWISSAAEGESPWDALERRVADHGRGLLRTGSKCLVVPVDSQPTYGEPCFFQLVEPARPAVTVAPATF